MFSGRALIRYALSRWTAAVLLSMAWIASAQSTVPEKLPLPAEAEGGFLATQGAQPKYEVAGKMSAEAELALRRQQIASIPNYTGSFPFEGRTLPFNTVGTKPQDGGTTEIPTQMLPLVLLFDGYAEANGDPVVLDPGSIVPRIKSSPNFKAAQYQTGFTQFADAVQRAQFNNVMKQDWHTTLGAPQDLKPVVIVVPKSAAKVFRNRASGTTYAVVDTEFFISHINTIVQLASLRVEALPILITRNVLLSPDGDVKRCCVLGFHTAFETGVNEGKQMVQTMVWASWIDSGLLGSGVADVTAMSHEISEWMNDPFGTNIVPAWQYPTASLGCQNNLETGDPLANLPNAGFPVLIDGVTYHPQNQVLLPWFTRQPSDAIDHAYSFPDQSLLSSPSQACPAK
jgi:hypothetical protein